MKLNPHLSIRQNRIAFLYDNLTVAFHGSLGPFILCQLTENEVLSKTVLWRLATFYSSEIRSSELHCFINKIIATSGAKEDDNSIASNAIDGIYLLLIFNHLYSVLDPQLKFIGICLLSRGPQATM